MLVSRSSSSDSSGTGQPGDYDDASQPLKRKQRFLRALKNLPRDIVDFFGIYLLLVFAYFTFVSMMASWIYYVAEPPGYLDSLFTVVSAITCTGLITFDTSKVPFGGQFIIWLLILIGSTVLNTVFPLFLRLYRFQRLLWSSTKTCDTRWVVIQRNAILLLLASVLGYFLFVQLGTAIFLISYSRADRDILNVYDGQGVNYVWGAFFFTASGFNNAGFSLFATNFVPFASEWVRSSRCRFGSLLHSFISSFIHSFVRSFIIIDTDPILGESQQVMLTTLAWLILAGSFCAHSALVPPPLVNSCLTSYTLARGHRKHVLSDPATALVLDSARHHLRQEPGRQPAASQASSLLHASLQLQADLRRVDLHPQLVGSPIHCHDGAGL